jgi:hypothetical protein
MIGRAPNPQPKRIYIAQRNRALSREQFIPRWRQHGKLAMSFMAMQAWQNVCRYVHCDAIHDHGVAGVSDQYDGMGILWFNDAESRKRHLGFAQARAALEVDEEETFVSRMKYGLGLVTREDIRLEGPACGVKMVYCSSMRDRDSPQDAIQAYSEQRAENVVAVLGTSLRRYVQSFPLPPENGTSWGLVCDMIDELWFDGIEALRVAYAKPEAQALHMSATTPASTFIAIVVHEIVLYPAAPASA